MLSDLEGRRATIEDHYRATSRYLARYAELWRRALKKVTFGAWARFARRSQGAWDVRKMQKERAASAGRR